MKDKITSTNFIVIFSFNENYQYSLKNNQEFEINPNILYRSNESENDAKYTPRVLLFDYTSNLGSMSKEGKLLTNHLNSYNKMIQQQQDRSGGDGMASFISQPVGNPMNRKDETVDYRSSTFEYWSDYMHTDLNGLSVIDVNSNSLPSTLSSSGSLFDDGIEILGDTTALTERYQDNLRRMIEECDQLQGFQAFADVDGLWGGMTTSILSHLSDEYGSRPVITFGSTPYSPLVHSNNQSVIEERLFNTTKAVSSISQFSSIYIPISSQHWDTINQSNFNTLNMNNNYQTSSIIASAIDTATLYYRSNYPYSLGEFCRSLSVQSLNLCTLSTTFPSSIAKLGIKRSNANNYNNSPYTYPSTPLFSNPALHYLTPFISNVQKSSFSEIISIRGDPIDEESNTIESQQSYDSVKKIIEGYIEFSKKNSIYSPQTTAICNISQPFIVDSLRFPAYNITKQKSQNSTAMEIDGQVAAKYDEPPQSILSHIQNGPLIASYLKPLCQQFKELTKSRNVQVYRTDEDPTSNEMIIEHLHSLNDSYSNVSNHNF
ncbi:hypothetical protein DFA_10191 [Cavenderia fasciculata]|uniref:DML1/Misato tubulin domain-containing protein n=1 Tax=Cavenderia fasciculata TaxID=261658 RepID=F4Q9I8_CACFS|nr:uncharacterized protein DFA_10191 [Cavenderia fasciculata]EGG15357.1 hypothetical protein DFA_10191 [Cavenderia fasciculata]|eukprot:XP_004354099.1 hypothetical protein DFA_10191 [Cavenderia fasciculata]